MNKGDVAMSDIDDGSRRGEAVFQICSGGCWHTTKVRPGEMVRLQLGVDEPQVSDADAEA